MSEQTAFPHPPCRAVDVPGGAHSCVKVKGHDEAGIGEPVQGGRVNETAIPLFAYTWMMLGCAAVHLLRRRLMHPDTQWWSWNANVTVIVMVLLWPLLYIVAGVLAVFGKLNPRMNPP